MPFSKQVGVTRLSQLSIDTNLVMGAHNVTLGAGQTVDGRDVSSPRDLIISEYGMPLYLDYSWFSVVQGTWVTQADANQTKCHYGMVNAIGYKTNSSTTDGDEIKIASVKLKPGRWKITVSYLKGTTFAILEVLFGAISLGTIDQYAAATAYNQESSLYLNITAETTDDLRFKISGRNAACVGWSIALAAIKVELVKADNT